MKRKYSVDIYDEVSDSILLRNSFVQLVKSSGFERFDYFLIRKWAGIECEINFKDLTEDDIQLLRKKAHRNFNKAIKGKNVANSRTIRKWFGLDEYLEPKRTMLFKLAFALGLSTEETTDYLVNGLMAPTFNINDYRELLYMYGLDNGLVYDDCMRMISVYEKRAGYETQYIQGNYTEELWEMYMVNKNCEPEEFLVWMLEHEDMFKGYSKTVLDCYISLTEDIQTCIRRDAKEYLEELITGSGYNEWKNNGNRTGDMKELVPRYIRRLVGSEGEDNEKLVKSIKSAYSLVYGESKNTNIIKNVYMHEGMIDASTEQEKFVNRTVGTTFSSHTDKYLSQILSVSFQKAYLMQLRSIMAKLNDMDDSEECPEGVLALLESHNVNVEGISNAGSCRKKVASLLVNQNQNCEMIGRDDILPLVHYLAQRQYANMMKDENLSYDMEQARNHFENLANAIMNKCRMLPISPTYRLDYLMLSSYCKEDMYSLADLIDAMADFSSMFVSTK